MRLEQGRVGVKEFSAKVMHSEKRDSGHQREKRHACIREARTANNRRTWGLGHPAEKNETIRRGES